MVTGPWLVAIFLFSIFFLLLTIIKFRMNAFLSLLITAVATALLVRMPIGEIANVTGAGFTATVGGIGIVTSLGVVLGLLLFESGGIGVIANTIIDTYGEKKSPAALGISAFLAGIPVFGDVVTVLFAPMVRALSRRTGIPRVAFVAAVAVSASVTASCVIPTPAPLAVCEILGLDIGVFFVYALLIGIVGMLAGGFAWGKIVGFQDIRRGRTYDMDDFEREESSRMEMAQEEGGPKISFVKSISIILIPIALIVVGSFATAVLGKDHAANPYFVFFGNKNMAMLFGVLCAMLIAKPYLKKPMGDIFSHGLDQVGMILMITGAGGAFGKIIQTTGIGDYLADVFADFNIPILLLCFVLAQIIRCAQGSTTVALTTTSSILLSSITASGLSPVLAGIAICSGGIGLSLPNDSGFWAINRFNRITIPDTFRAWTVGGFVAGAAMFLVTCVLSLFQNMLPGL
ncbi:MAG: GntP family permease [Planctomycetota bacterium]|nr:GntP family permease [Planctomycetota bacterium]